LGRVEPRDAATVMLVRQGDRGREVFMLRRNLDSVGWSGLYLFPGGAVDESDRHTDLERVVRGLTDAEASDILGIDKGGLAFWVAAVRECFEEAGVLLVDGDLPDDIDAHRAAVDNGELELYDLLTRFDLTIPADRITYVSHWITPEGAPRRYDTRFFVASAPAGQRAHHDDREAIAHLWIDPADALERHRAGELDMLPPTVANLRWLCRN
jgi:8-oxo-dGTP pyrophosphatase MutT (NUDIX family)